MHFYWFILGLVFLSVVVHAGMRHHRRQDFPQAGGYDEDQALATEMKAKVDKLEDRIRTLERILDAEAPEWRART